MFFKDIISGVLLGFLFSILLFMFCDIEKDLAFICFIGLSFSFSVFINMIRKHDMKVLSNMVKDNFKDNN